MGCARCKASQTRWCGRARGFEDGGGLPSQGKVPHTERETSSHARAIRSLLWRHVIALKLPGRLVAKIKSPSDSALLTQEEADKVAEDLSNLIRSWGIPAGLEIAPGQDVRLGLLEAVAHALGDPDASYCSILKQGVNVFEFSAPGIFEERADEQDGQADPSAGCYEEHTGNYTSVRMNLVLA